MTRNVSPTVPVGARRTGVGLRNLVQVYPIQLASGTWGITETKADATGRWVVEQSGVIGIDDSSTTGGARVFRKGSTILAAAAALVDTGVKLLSDSVEYWLAKDFVASTGIAGVLGNHTATDPGGTNTPKFLPYTGTQYAYFPGTTGNYVSTPDAAGISLTGEIELQWFGAADDWTPGTFMGLLSKWNANTGYMVRLTTSGTLQLFLDANIATSSVAVGWTDGTEHGIKVTWRPSDGRVQFFEIDQDGAEVGQIGSDQTIAIASFTDSGEMLAVGAYRSAALASNFFAGDAKWAKVLDGIGGTEVANPDFTSDPTEPFSTFSDAAGNTWTINQAGSGAFTEIVAAPALWAHTDDYLTVADHADFRVGAADSFTLTMVARFPGTAASEFVASRRETGAPTEGWDAGFTSGTNASVRANDGTNLISPAAAHGLTTGKTHTLAVRLDRATDLFELVVDGTVQVSGSAATIGAMDAAVALELFRYSSSYGRLSLIGAAYHAAARTDEEIAAIGAKLIEENAA